MLQNIYAAKYDSVVADEAQVEQLLRKNLGLEEETGSWGKQEEDEPNIEIEEKEEEEPLLPPESEEPEVHTIPKGNIFIIILGRRPTTELKIIVNSVVDRWLRYKF